LIRQRQVGVNRLFNVMDLTVIKEEGDGNCLFRAIARQLSLILQKQFTHELLRRECCSYIRENASTLKRFMLHNELKHILAVEKYVSQMSRNGVYGDDYGMTSLMKSYGFDVDIFTVQEDGCLVILSRTPESTAPKFKVRILLQNGFAIVIQLFGPKMLLQQEKLMYQFLDFKEACKENVEQQVTEQ